MQKNTKAWDQIFQEKGKVFEDPHEDMSALVQTMKGRGVKTVLDLGCGSGRHTVYLAKNGFRVFGLDNSESGIEITKQWLKKEDISAKLQVQEMTNKFPYDDASFDAIVSIQVIHHADVATIKNIIAEMERVIKKGGFIFITVPKLKNQGINFKQIEPNTFIPLDGREKGLPHHYFTPEELIEFFHSFEVIDIHLDQGNHYCLSAVKL